MAKMLVASGSTDQAGLTVSVVGLSKRWNALDLFLFLP